MIFQRINLILLLVTISALPNFSQPLMYLELEEYDSQLTAVNKKLATDSTNADLVIERSFLLIELNDYEAALKDVYKARALNGNESQINLLRAELANVSKNYGISERFVEKAESTAKSNSERHNAYLSKAYLLQLEGDLLKSAEIAEDALRLDSSLNALYLNASINKALSEFEKSEFFYKQLIAKETNRHSLYLQLADLYIKQEDYEKAKIQAMIAYELQPENALIHNYLGTIYYHLGNYPKSLSHVNTALHLDPNNYNIFKERAFIYLKLNEVNNACDDMFRSLQNGYQEDNVTMDLLSLYMKVCEI